MLPLRRYFSLKPPLSSTTIGIWALVLALSIGLSYSTPVQELELKTLDQSFNLLRRLAPKAIANDVVVIGIDAQTYQTFPEPFALWHQHLAELFRALAQAQPKIVGLDIGFPDRSYDSVIAGIDKQLLSGMAALTQVAPMVLGISVEASGEVRQVYPPYLAVAGKDGHAFVLWHLDRDRVIRRQQHILDAQGNILPTLSTAMAQKLKLPVQEGLIDYTVGAPMSYIPLQQVLSWYQQGQHHALQAALQDKVILIGTVLAFEDRHYQPVNLISWEAQNRNHIPGVFIHAQAMRSLLTQGFITIAPDALNLGILIALSCLNWLSLSLWHSGILGILLTLLLSSAQLLLLHHGVYVPLVAALLTLLLALSSRQAQVAVALLQERRRLKRVFSGYVAPQVMQEILSGKLSPGVHGERKYVCVMFSDIRNFTRISERLEPEQVISFLDKYLDAMVNAIQHYEGTIDKFMGDGIMAFFGAPGNLDNPCANAFAAAQAKLAALAALNQRMQDDPDFPQLSIGIGLHAGDAVVGNIGSAQRNEYTAIGDVINTGSRLEGLTKQLGYPLIVSQAVVKQLGATETFDDLGEIPVKGRAPVRVFGWPAKLASTPGLTP